jgi:hypothetical protein
VDEENPAKPAIPFIPHGGYDHLNGQTQSDQGDGRRYINNRGEVLGHIYGDPYLQYHGYSNGAPAIWRNGRGHNLDDLAASGPESPSYENIRAQAINDKGFIAAMAYDRKQKVRVPVFLLPVEMEELESIQVGDSWPLLMECPNIPAGTYQVQSYCGSRVMTSKSVSFTVDDTAATIDLTPGPSDKPGSLLSIRIQGQGIDARIPLETKLIAGDPYSIQATLTGENNLISDDSGTVPVKISVEDEYGNKVEDNTRIVLETSDSASARPATGEEIEFLDNDSALAIGDYTPEEITPELLTKDGEVEVPVNMPLSAHSHLHITAGGTPADAGITYNGVQGNLSVGGISGSSSRELSFTTGQPVADGTKVRWLYKPLQPGGSFYAESLMSNGTARTMIDRPAGRDSISCVFAICADSVSASYFDLLSPIGPGQFSTYMQYPMLHGVPVDGGSVSHAYELMAARLEGRYAGHGYAVGRNISQLQGINPTPIPIKLGDEENSPVLTFFAPSGAQGLIKGPAWQR